MILVYRRLLLICSHSAAYITTFYRKGRIRSATLYVAKRIF